MSADSDSDGNDSKYNAINEVPEGELAQNYYWAQIIRKAQKPKEIKYKGIPQSFVEWV